MPGMGSTGPADAATEAFMRYLAAEVGPRGVRVCGIWTAGVAETLSEKKLTEVGGANAPEPRSVVEMIAGMAALCRAPRLAEVVEVAVFLASDGAAGMTGTIDADPTDRREAASWISSSNSCWFPSRTWTPPTPSTSRKPASLWTSSIASVTSYASCSRRHRARRARPPWGRGSRKRRRAPFQLAGLDGTRTGATIARATRLSGISTAGTSFTLGGEGVRTNQPGTCRVPGDSIHPGPGAMRSQPHSPQRGQHMPTTSGRHPFAALRPVCPC